MKILSTKEKSVHINIKSEYYGTIAEIGGGQETARHLFQAGGASNTIAKSISAYDKLFSDHFYNDGTATRYVAEDRLRKMVNYEYQELINILGAKNDKKFFAFANTVELLNFSKTNTGTGWLGIAVEGTKRDEPNMFFIHAKFHENDTLLQQYTLGSLGINLIYGGLFEGKDPRNILLSLLDNLDSERIEIDYIFVEGPDMEWVDNRLLNLMLVRNNMTPAIMFDCNGRIHQASDMLYKKNVMLMRGYFRPINNLGMEFIDNSLEIFQKDEDYTPENTLAFCEISLNFLMQGENVNEKDFLHRVDLLNLMGKSVMISRFERYFELVNYFRQFKLIKLRMVVGLPTFIKIFDSKYYKDIKGGVLEALGAMFQENVKVYLYPGINEKDNELILPQDSCFEGKNVLLWKYLNASGNILLLTNIKNESLHIKTEFITQMIENGDEELKKYLPLKVYNHIKENKLFGFAKNVLS